MNKKKIAVIASVVTVIAVGAYAFQIIGSEAALMDRFPDEDPKLVVKASRKMLRRALTGDEAIDACQTEEDYDKIFLEIIEDLKK